MEFSRQADTGVGSHSLLQGIFLTQDLTGSPALQEGPLPSEPPGEVLVGTDPTHPNPQAELFLDDVVSKLKSAMQ